MALLLGSVVLFGLVFVGRLRVCLLRSVSPFSSFFSTFVGAFSLSGVPLVSGSFWAVRRPAFRELAVAFVGCLSYESPLLPHFRYLSPLPAILTDGVDAFSLGVRYIPQDEEFELMHAGQKGVREIGVRAR